MFSLNGGSISTVSAPTPAHTWQHSTQHGFVAQESWHNYGIGESMNLDDGAATVEHYPSMISESDWENSFLEHFPATPHASHSSSATPTTSMHIYQQSPPWNASASRNTEMDHGHPAVLPETSARMSLSYILGNSHHTRSVTAETDITLSGSPAPCPDTVFAPDSHSDCLRPALPLLGTSSMKENRSPSAPLSPLADAAEIIPQSKRRKRMTEDEQAIDVLQYMKRNYCHLTLPKLIARIFDSENDTLINFRTHFCHDREFLLSFIGKLFDQSSGYEVLHDIIKLHALRVVEKEVDTEFVAAQRIVQNASKACNLDFLRNWSPSHLVAQLDMPTTKSLIVKMTTGRSTDENKLKDNQVLRDTVVLQLMHGRSNLSNYLQLGIGLSTWSMGASKQTTELLSHCGLSTSTVTIERAVNAIGQSSIDEGKLSPFPRFASYDNLNLCHSNTYEQRPDAPAKVQSGTFTLIYELPHISWKTMEIEPIINAFKQARPLTIDDITASEDQVLSFYEQTKVHLVQILLNHAEGFESYTGSRHPSLQHKPRHKLPRNRHNNFFPLRIAAIEEASVSGQILVHDDIFMNQLDCDNPSYPERGERLRKHAMPFCVDQLTLSRIRTAQRERARDLDPYHTRQIIQLVFGMFHFIMNLMWALLGVHRGTLDDLGSLSFFFAILDKVRLGQDRPDYHTLRMALMQILDGIVLAAWEKVHGYSSFPEFADSKPTPEQLLKLAEKIYTSYCFHESKADTSEDKAFFNLQLLLRDLLYVRELLDAVSAGDIGRCEDIFPDLAHIFRGAGSNNYSVEILWFLHNVKNVWTPEFANVMRECMIVNIDGHFMPTDLNIEHFIGYVKELFASKGIYSGWTRFGNVTAAVKALMTLRHRVAEETRLSYQKKGHTTPESVKKLVLRVADAVNKHQLQHFLPNRRPRNDTCHSVPDLLTKGRSLLLGRTLKAFNETVRALADAYTGRILREECFRELEEESRDTIPENMITFEDNGYTALNYAGLYDNIE
ncbi:hypothetical protein VNI00_019052 [Paramarasmius palmivorus]|uniref:DUF6589 domain-containing protein n=1 Tax=Paramarasmius palmivorus TaxID=297713 RepID=A0AAW0ATB5_9AGAR